MGSWKNEIELIVLRMCVVEAGSDSVLKVLAAWVYSSVIEVRVAFFADVLSRSSQIVVWI